MHQTNELENFLRDASPVEHQLVTDFIKSLEKKRSGDYSTFINAAFQFDITFPEDQCTVKMPVTPLCTNSFHMPHGGVIATLIDNAMGFLVNKDLRSIGKGAVTTNLTVHYTKATNDPMIYATASYIHKGRQTLVLEASAYSESGQKIAYATGSFFVIDLPTPQ
ncbi:PaaI family thioesterase [Chryseomicrobium palamuruense]|uniref:PaaI family thioesterase n=1 Tax=Chryseomicrobium palamuruense TaxID=682973 RepID=A0ABV8UTS9_9BACL